MIGWGGGHAAEGGQRDDHEEQGLGQMRQETMDEPGIAEKGQGQGHGQGRNEQRRPSRREPPEDEDEGDERHHRTGAQSRSTCQVDAGGRAQLEIHAIEKEAPIGHVSALHVQDQAHRGGRAAGDLEALPLEGAVTAAVEATQGALAQHHVDPRGAARRRAEAKRQLGGTREGEGKGEDRLGTAPVQSRAPVDLVLREETGEVGARRRGRG